MARLLHVLVHLVVPDAVSEAGVRAALVGRELPSVPGSWVASVDVHEPGPADDGHEDAFEEVLAAEADADAGLT